MADQNFTTYIRTNRTPKEAFDAIKNVKAWWTENMEGNSDGLNDEFTVTFDDVHISRQKVIELVPNQKIVWLVTASKLSFVNNQNEWTGTKIVFEIVQRGNKTEVWFSHQGLLPSVEGFEACTNAWSEYIHESLQNLIAEGEGNPVRNVVAGV